MEALKASSFPPFHRQLIQTPNPTKSFPKPIPNTPRSRRISTFLLPSRKPNSKIFTAISPAVESPPPLKDVESENLEAKFDWYSHWYPVWPVHDLDKRRPHAKKVIGIDLVVWWDRNESAWKVFEDSCPHRLAPLSEGRIDQWGRLQCVYHGWCFGGAGDCKFIPQAPRDGPPAHASKRACAGVYPSCVQNGIVWFWPNSGEEYKEIYSTKKPPYIPELDDPSFNHKLMISRDLPYGYEILIENLMDPAHFAYAHYGIMETAKVGDRVKADREGGVPLELSVEKVNVNGFTSKQVVGENHFVAPCLYYAYFSPTSRATNSKVTSEVVLPPMPPNKESMLIFLSVPVSPGYSRVIFGAPRNYGVWLDRIIPRWIQHMVPNLILDSDILLLHLEERKVKDVGATNWLKACYVPTKSDALVVAFRRWLNKYGGTQFDWRGRYSNGELPPTPPREQLFDRYWTHTVGCSSCNAAYKRLNALQIGLQVISVASTAAVAAAGKGAIPIGARYGWASMAVVCFVASKWLSHFIYKNFLCHDYDHAFR